MPAYTYLQAAAAEIRKAILEKRHDVDVRKKEIADRQQAAQQRVQELKSNERQKEILAGSGNTDDSQRIRLLAQINDDINKEVEAQKNFDQERDRLQQEINSIERDIIDLENKAKELETRA